MAAGQWSTYVEKELIPRLHGFELLMASYAMCHMKLDMMLTELGYKPTGNPPRLGVYLTNSLEEGERANQTLPFAQWLSNEAKEANTIKRDMPIMCVIGNPPYSASSKNTGEWITDLIEDYKYVDGAHFNERKHWLHDDYVKFIRLAEHLIDKNGEGVLAFITNHGYLDNPTFRGMRFRLLETFDKLFVMDLHGNSKREEVSPLGGTDQNVFDIQQGVSILVAAKKKSNSKQRIRGQKNGIELGKIFHKDLWGERIAKYTALWTHKISPPEWTELLPTGPYFMFLPRSYENIGRYQKGFSIRELMNVNVTGVITARDSFAIGFDREEQYNKLLDFTNTSLSDLEIRTKYFPNKSEPIETDKRAWKLGAARTALRGVNIETHLLPYAYRPFDNRIIFYRPEVVDWGRQNYMSHMIEKNNIAFVVCRQSINDQWANVLLTNLMGDDSFVSNRSKERGYYFPLYLYPDEQDLDQKRRVNFEPKIHKTIVSIASMKGHIAVNEEAIFDYIYGVLHAPNYRETYKEFLKIDFPRVPYPPSPDVFWDISAKGTQLRKLHLMEDAAIGPTLYQFTGEGDSSVVKIAFKPLSENKETGVCGAVYINDKQAFQDVPQIAWEFYIGGYQPAQKWLKDRKGRQLTWDDIRHYQKIVKILSETDRIMKTIEMPLD